MSAKAIYDIHRKTFPEQFAHIQKWFNDQTGIDSKTHFYNQPIWKHELLNLFLLDFYNIVIDTDCRFVKQFNNFFFIFKITDVEKNMSTFSNGLYQTRAEAEFAAFVETMKHLTGIIPENKTNPHENAQAKIIGLN